jgi:D-aminoacyl-tRNA deacylase
MILLAYSSKDVAGINIAEQVLRFFSFRVTSEVFQETPVHVAEVNQNIVKLVQLKEEAVYAQDLPEQFSNVELLVFLSRHSSQSGKPTLSVHTPGNFGGAELGGLPRKVSVAPATAMRDALKALQKFKLEMSLDFEVSYECTHHGPSLNLPTMFVELGSSPQQWNDVKAAEAVANAAMEAVAKFHKPKNSAVLGIGGTHYNQRFTKMALDDEAALGHIIPKYAIPSIDSEILSQCVERTLEKVSHALLDWKGMHGEDKQRILDLLKELGLPYEKA